ncbi:GNAT family N-acetyltransferase [Pelagibacterium halotolerans]|uniref:GNAT family N-acetyltransferase n=1 Tax=Pelagibacterium halotolerans TaxID=531813 RepID=UPI00384E3067
MQKSVRLKSFDLIAQDIAEADIQLLHALSIGVGWPHRPADWEFLRRVGQGIVVVDGIGRVFGSAMWFPHGTDFATIGLVITTPRAQAQGAGRWLMEQVLEHCGQRDLSLNATKPSYSLYVSLGFIPEATVFLHNGIAARLPDLPAPNGTLGALPVDGIEEITAIDTRAFGADRSQLLAQLAKGGELCILRRDDRIVGYAMRREFGRGHVIGPIVAENDDDAIQLAGWHLRAMEGRFVRIDTREQDGPFPALLEQAGLVVGETTTTMSKGRRFLNRTAGAPWVYGLAGHALS